MSRRQSRESQTGQNRGRQNLRSDKSVESAIGSRAHGLFHAVRPLRPIDVGIRCRAALEALVNPPILLRACTNEILEAGDEPDNFRMRMLPSLKVALQEMTGRAMTVATTGTVWLLISVALPTMWPGIET